MRNLRVPDLAIGADAGHLNLGPIDDAAHRVQHTPASGGVGASFIDVRPRAGFAILSPGTKHAVIDATASDYIGGLVGRLPVKDATGVSQSQFEARNAQ